MNRAWFTGWHCHVFHVSTLKKNPMTGVADDHSVIKEINVCVLVYLCLFVCALTPVASRRPTLLLPPPDIVLVLWGVAFSTQKIEQENMYHTLLSYQCQHYKKEREKYRQTGRLTEGDLTDLFSTSTPCWPCRQAVSFLWVLWDTCLTSSSRFSTWWTDSRIGLSKLGISLQTHTHTHIQVIWSVPSKCALWDLSVPYTPTLTRNKSSGTDVTSLDNFIHL